MSERTAAPLASGVVCVTFHAERLHDDRTWVFAERLAIRAAEQGAALTFFVHPFWAVMAGAGEVAARRVKRLHELGHEIGQHTHYYDRETGVRPGHKVTDLDSGNVLRRLDEDYAWLLEAGVEPRGFVSGAWAIPEVLAAWLAERGFAYDCSYRTFALPYRSGPAAISGDGAAGPFWLHGGVLEVPTTTPLRAAVLPLLGRPRALRRGGAGYGLVYLHDDDQLDWRKRLALRAVIHGIRERGYQMMSVEKLAEMLRPVASGRTS